MAESIALGLRLGTTAEHANFAGIEGEITINETEKRAVVHDGTTKGGFPMARLDETGYSLAKSDDGTKLQLKNKAGVVLSETDAPSGGSGSGDAIPKTGNRGSLAGYQTIETITAASGDVVTINEESPDTLYITQKDKNSNFTIKIERTLGSETASTKLVLLYCNWPALVTVQLGTGVYVDNYMSNGFVNELAVEGIERWVIPFSEWTFVSKLKYL